MWKVTVRGGSCVSDPTTKTSLHDPKQHSLHSVYPGSQEQTLWLLWHIHHTVHVSMSQSEEWAYLAL